jgi:virulence-associated protein VapD
MAQYAIAFDLDTTAMRTAGFTQAQIVGVYQREIPDALTGCGFSVHPQGSIYHTARRLDVLEFLDVAAAIGFDPCAFVRALPRR